ncbi:hypothetical protein FP2506_05956 [Fulvimarina pelagi HTCC2506]|uniref:Extensin-like C-terminal domain-containing protein n=1 Tax=Fulvimarina pelagi HTCC2506 TaxID=314231 RepID=Q0G7K5_9HYPH|nr:extensin family protein [Fulvimarina pelagi]EAU42359.1 hypothetical protein FP2506_05956 [Fulvimarina pelagi HTCC2506]
MRLILPSLMLCFALAGGSFAQDAGETVPRPEARPDEAADLANTEETTSTPAAADPRSVNEANSRAANGTEIEVDGAPASPATTAADPTSAPADPDPETPSTSPAAALPAIDPASSAETEATERDTTDSPTTPQSETSGDDAATPVETPEATSVDSDAVPLPEARPDEPASGPTPSPTVSDASAAPSPRDALPSPSESKLQPVSPAAAVRAAKALLASEACEARLTELGVTFETGTSINSGSCGVLRPVSVSALSNGVEVRTQNRMWCPVVDALEDWITDAVAPAASEYLPDRTLTGIARVSTYVCRNRGSGEKISEHARGAAIDIGAFVFEDGEVAVSAADPNSPEGRFLDAVRAAACGPFTTVLGPGTDADHANHFHFDLAARSSGPYCR